MSRSDRGRTHRQAIQMRRDAWQAEADSPSSQWSRESCLEIVRQLDVELERLDKGLPPIVAGRRGPGRPRKTA